ncbi:MAG: hypothetical protein PHC97_02450 [Patescibacteria group bacterium]|nr:hypothetical protein [Patescibacteria group bacterium]
MAERFGEKKEQKKKYFPKPENIVALDENSELRKRNEQVFAGLAEEGVEIPIELQGYGRTDYDKKEFKIGYPAGGDVLLSFVVIIHELGHLREKEVENDNDRLAEENSAWQRGLKRLEKYDPKILKYLEEKFKKFKDAGKLTKFKNFIDYYQYVREVISQSNEIMEKFIEKGDVTSKKFGVKFAKDIKANPLIKEFLLEQGVWRTGEKVDSEVIEDFIKKMADKISEE